MLNKNALEKKKALLFDCDNTLALTMNAHKKAYELAFNLHGVPFDEREFDTYAPLGGNKLMKTLVIDEGYAHLVKDIIKDKQRFLTPCLEKLMVPNEELIELIKKEGRNILIGVVSNGRKNSIEQVLIALGIRFYVHVLVTKEHVYHSKPYADPYYLAMEMLGVKPEECIVFEDNEIGVASAKAAGIKDIVEVTI